MSTAKMIHGGLRLLRKEAQTGLQKHIVRESTRHTRCFSSTSQTTRTQNLLALQNPQKTFRASNGTSQAMRHVQGRRGFSATAVVSHGHFTPPKPGEEVYVTFVDKDGDENRFAVNVGDDLLSIAQEFDVDMEGACEGSCSCSTCHVIVESEEMYDKLEEADDDENDMLDLAFGLTETSRLGCQIKMTKELDGLRVRLPAMTRNMQASDFAKK